MPNSLAKAVALPPSGHVPTEKEVKILVIVGVHSASMKRTIVGGVPVGTDAMVEADTFEVVKKKEEEGLVRILARMPDEQAAMFIATKAAAPKATYIKRRINAPPTLWRRVSALIVTLMGC